MLPPQRDRTYPSFGFRECPRKSLAIGFLFRLKTFNKLGATLEARVKQHRRWQPMACEMLSQQLHTKTIYAKFTFGCKYHQEEIKGTQPSSPSWRFEQIAADSACLKHSKSTASTRRARNVRRGQLGAGWSLATKPLVETPKPISKLYAQHIEPAISATLERSGLGVWLLPALVLRVWSVYFEFSSIHVESPKQHISIHN